MKKFIHEPFDDEERALMEAVESGKTKSVSKAELARIKASVPHAKNVTIRLQAEDIIGIKTKAEKAGIPYQTLINSVLHRYLTGALVSKESL